MTEARPAGLLINHVSKDLGGRTIVSDMQLEVHAGELTCLLGPSGCGKTTTARTQSTKRLRPRTRRRLRAYGPQVC